MAVCTKLFATSNPPPDTIFGSNSTIRIENIREGSFNEAFIKKLFADTTGWYNVKDINLDDLKDKNEFLIKTNLPNKTWTDPAISLNGYATGFEIYQNTRLIYEFGNDKSDNKSITYYNIHFISLDSNYAGATLIMRVHINNILYNTASFSSMMIGNKDDLIKLVFDDRSKNIRGELLNFILGMFLIFSGLISCIVFIIRRKKVEILFLYFTLFTVTEGYTLLTGLLFQIINISPFALIISSVISSNLIPIGLLGVVKVVTNRPRRSLLSLMIIIHVVFTVLFLVFLATFSLEFGYWLLIGIDIIVGIIAFIKSKIYKSKEFRIPFISICLLFLLVILDMLAVFGVYYFMSDLSSYGMILLVFAFGYYIERKYSQAQLKINNYETELALAKNKLLSLENENILSQYEALKNQVNPHFLFNSLNTLASLIRFEPNNALKFIEEFADIYRYVLDVKDKILVTVKEELDFVQSYTYLQKLRHNQNLELLVKINVECLHKFIVPLSLQILVENAIKHNEISETYPLTIEINCENDWIIVKNNINKIDSHLLSKKVGLKNLTERYNLITDKMPIFSLNNNEYIARIPIINEED